MGKKNASLAAMLLQLSLLLQQIMLLNSNTDLKHHLKSSKVVLNLILDGVSLKIQCWHSRMCTYKYQVHVPWPKKFISPPDNNCLEAVNKLES